MRWLVHGSNTTPAVAAALVRHGDKAAAPAEIQLPVDAPPRDVLAAATKQQLDIVTSDPVLAAAPFESKIYFKRAIVFLQLEGTDVEQDDAIDRLFARYKRLSPARLYTVTGTRVKVRQLPSGLLSS